MSSFEIHELKEHLERLGFKHFAYGDDIIFIHKVHDDLIISTSKKKVYPATVRKVTRASRIIALRNSSKGEKTNEAQ